MIDPQLEGRVAIVTGANHGIGAAAAEALSTHGTKVLVHYYRPPCCYSQEEMLGGLEMRTGGDLLYRAMQQQSADALVARIHSHGTTAFAHEADLGHPRSIPALFDLCEGQLGPADILINNHTHCVMDTFDPARATSEPPAVRVTSAESIDGHFAINARAYALLMSEYVRRYLERQATWGRIVNVTTDAAHAHVANISYAASKHAIESYSRSAAAELGRHGITVNIVAPGPIQTGYITPEMEAGIAASTPLGRVGQPDDVADVIVFLASHQARWLTGQLLYVGGGYRMPQ